jgi:hypothetical protein
LKIAINKKISGIEMNLNKRKMIILLISIILFFPLGSAYAFPETPNFSVNRLDDVCDIPVYRAVLIGIGSVQGLPYSVKQSQGIKQTLINGGNWDEENIKLLTDNMATKDTIKQSINWLAESADENDVSIFYFIGHGGGGPNGSDYFISASDTVIFDEQLDLYFENISGSLIIIIDSCNSGGFIDELWQTNRVIITACAADESTYQVDALKAPMFSYFLNMSLSRLTKNAEFTFVFTKLFTQYYGNKISDEYNSDYTIDPQFYDGTLGPTRVIKRHTYLKQVTDLIKPLFFSHDNLNIWKMNN